VKKYICFLCFLCFASVFGNKLKAQTSPEFGIRAGVNFANITDTNADRRIGFMGGVYGDFMISNSNLSIQPELLYTQKGVKKKVDVQGGGTVKGKVRLDYIEIPILVKYNFVSSGSVNPNLYVGPYVGFNVNSDVKVKNNQGKASVGIGSNTKDTDFGIVVGGSLDFGYINVGLRYGFGLIDVSKNGASGKNSVLSIVAGVGF
jgi:hypothetical protein